MRIFKKIKKLKKHLLLFFLIFVFACSSLAGSALAQEEYSSDTEQPTEIMTPVSEANKEEVFEAQVIEILEEKEITRDDGSKSIGQKLKLKGLEGRWKNQEIIFDGTRIDIIAKNYYKKGDKVLVSANQDMAGNEIYYINDFVRRGPLYLLILIFVLIIALTSKWRGLRAILSLGVSFLIILKFIIPQILAGANPLLISSLWALVIIVVTTYLVYGLNKKSSLAILGTFLGILMVGILSIIFTNLVRLTGFAQEETVYLVGLTGETINFKGLLLAGFIIGALGVIDDITISQVSTVKELSEANSSLTKKEIYRKAMNVGIDHIASMVNTLFLAYAGASFSLLLLLTLHQPPFATFNQVINHEVITTEIVRTLVGSIGLALAVPITTLIAVYFYKRKKYDETI